MSARIQKMAWIVLHVAAVGMFTEPLWAKTTKPSPLIYRNHWSSPEEVLRAFLSYDEEGKIWAGMGDIERGVFTAWDTPPPVETFYRFSEKQIGPTQKTSATEVRIPVTWKVTRHQDGFGTEHSLPSRKAFRQFFVLKKKDGSWRIHAPLPQAYIPLIRGP
jgi:hypothetical protein